MHPHAAMPRMAYTSHLLDAAAVDQGRRGRPPHQLVHAPLAHLDHGVAHEGKRFGDLQALLDLAKIETQEDSGGGRFGFRGQGSGERKRLTHLDLVQLDAERALDAGVVQSMQQRPA